jgi:hypothetical protein
MSHDESGRFKGNVKSREAWRGMQVHSGYRSATSSMSCVRQRAMPSPESQDVNAL